jgi:hypothetical protein
MVYQGVSTAGTFCGSFLVIEMQIQGSLVKWIPDFYETPLYNGEPCDFRLTVLVTDGGSHGPAAEELLEVLSEEYDKACAWWRDATGRKVFFDPPFEAQQDGSLIVKLTAKLAYEEFPIPVVDTELQPIARDLRLRIGSEALVAVQPMFIPRKSSKGGLRLCPKGMQILTAVTSGGSDRGDFDITKAFSKQSGFKQSKPNLKEAAKAATVAGEDPDF